VICTSEFVDNLKYSLLLSRLMHSHPSMFLKIFINDEVVGKYLEVPSMKLSYKSYIKWLIPRMPKFLLK
ncbi:MAG: hypothetical protein KAR85_06770, partial [Methanosarcinales archaeon]|nr:hypothetical protein [Methanosarcinales archaeon]